MRVSLPLSNATSEFMKMKTVTFLRIFRCRGGARREATCGTSSKVWPVDVAASAAERVDPTHEQGHAPTGLEGGLRTDQRTEKRTASCFFDVESIGEKLKIA